MIKVVHQPGGCSVLSFLFNLYFHILFFPIYPFYCNQYTFAKFDKLFMQLSGIIGSFYLDIMKRNISYLIDRKRFFCNKVIPQV